MHKFWISYDYPFLSYDSFDRNLGNYFYYLFIYLFAQKTILTLIKISVHELDKKANKLALTMPINTLHTQHIKIQSVNQSLKLNYLVYLKNTEKSVTVTDRLKLASDEKSTVHLAKSSIHLLYSYTL